MCWVLFSKQAPMLVLTSAGQSTSASSQNGISGFRFVFFPPTGTTGRDICILYSLNLHLCCLFCRVAITLGSLKIFLCMAGFYKMCVAPCSFLHAS